MTDKPFGARGPTKPTWKGRLVSVMLTRNGIRLMHELTGEETPIRHVGRFIEVEVPFNDEIIIDLKRIVDASVTEKLENGT